MLPFNISWCHRLCWKWRSYSWFSTWNFPNKHHSNKTGDSWTRICGSKYYLLWQPCLLLFLSFFCNLSSSWNDMQLSCASKKKRRVLLNIFLHPMLSIKFRVRLACGIVLLHTLYVMYWCVFWYFRYSSVYFLQFVRLGATFLKCAQRLMQIKFTGKALKRNSEVKISLTFLTGAWEISLYD